MRQITKDEIFDNGLHFVSIEGNWDKDIHDERIAQAVKILNENKAALVIASGTYAPPPYASFFQGRLGEYTTEVLINKYHIPAMRIIPAYLFPYTSTYTIIDALTNAALIGWLTCGLKRRNDRMNVLFEPTTSAFHSLRVEMLNLRACALLIASEPCGIFNNSFLCQSIIITYDKEILISNKT